METTTMHAWHTHEITNQVDEHTGYNLLGTDTPLLEALQRSGADGFVPSLLAYAEELGSPESFATAEAANQYTPELRLFDKRGRRLDVVDFHPSWHRMGALYRRQGMVSMGFDSERTGRWAAWAAGFYLQGQVEAGVLCPATMTQAAIPLLQKEPGLWAQLKDKLYSPEYDERDLPIAHKKSIAIGMGMTEKQGGSDVRANTTTATPVGPSGRGKEYQIRGHKWFFSAPMCDAHLVVAQVADGGPSCFFVPRWKPDGTKNAVHIQRLKDKVGNRSNSSCEVEFLDAYGILMGEEGRGIPTIIEMATYTRLNCVVGSAGLLRQGLVQAIAYARHRTAFGKKLIDQPLMRSVLTDLALENEGNVALMMRLATAYEQHAHSPVQRTWMRIATPAAKFWVCKRAVELTGETMEVFGGNGYMDEYLMGRLFREAPVNSIWEGSGNVMCLDVMRAVAREPDGFFAILDELHEAATGEARLQNALQALRDMVNIPPAELEALGRRFSERLALLTQAALLHKHAPAHVSQAFIQTRLDPHWGHVAGNIDTRGLDVPALLQRAFPA